VSRHTPQKPGISATDKQKWPGFFRRLAAIFYDLFLLLAVLFLATAIELPFNAGEAFQPEHISILSGCFLSAFYFMAGFGRMEAKPWAFAAGK